MIVAGHICVDLIPVLRSVPAMAPGQLTDVGPLTVRAGGCVANTGIDLAALGVPVRLAADVGDDALGRLLLELLEHPNADLAAVRTVADDTSYSVVVQPPDGDRSFWHHVGANAGFDGGYIDLNGVDMLHLGYPTALAALHRAGGAPLDDILGRAQRKGVTTSIDLATFEPGSAAAQEDWPAVLRRIAPQVDVLAASVDDLRCVFGAQAGTGRTALDLAEWFLDAGVGMVLLKAGVDGLHLLSAEASRLRQAGRGLDALADSWANLSSWASSIEVDVVTTTGAGDAAVAGLLCGIACCMDPAQALRVAASAAAARIGTHGRLDPWPELSESFAHRCEVAHGVRSLG